MANEHKWKGNTSTNIHLSIPFKVTEHYEVEMSFRKHNKKQINILPLNKYKVLL